MSAKFTVYAVDTGPIDNVSSDHTFVLSSDGHNWNCFGRGADAINQANVLRSANASSKWASLIYGTDPAPDSQPAAGLRLNYDGVCQNAANRILVLADDDVDARGSRGNAGVTLMYGKYGFNIQQYIEAVKNTGAQLLQDSPGEINPSDIQVVLDRINQGQTPDAELDILHADIKADEKIVLPDITDAQRNAFRPIYSDYQADRYATFLATANTVSPGTQIAFGLFKNNLIPAWIKCLTRLTGVLTAEDFKAMFGKTPDEVKSAIA